jgi:hypothetical protein
VFRESVEESRDEHVACQTAERIEMNVQSSPTPSGRPISNAKYSTQRQARACDSRRSQL